MAVVGVVPAAGFASRLQPLAGSKESLIVGGRPLIGHLLERLAAAGADRIRIVTRPEKRDVVALAAGLGHEVVLAETPTVSASVLAGLDGLGADDIVLLGFPDSIWEPVDGFAALRQRIERGDGLALGLFRSDEPGRSDVVRTDVEGRLVGIDVKPRAPRSPWIWGCLAARHAVLARLPAESELSHFVAALGRRSAVPTIRFGRILDVGTQTALAAAENHPLVLAAARGQA